MLAYGSSADEEASSCAIRHDASQSIIIHSQTENVRPSYDIEQHARHELCTKTIHATFLNFSQKGRRWYWPSLCPPSVHEHGGSTSILRMEEYEYHILFLSSKLKHRYHTSKRCVNIQFFMIGLTFTGIIQFSKNVDRIFYKRV